MKANIGFKGLEIECIIGVLPEERVNLQKIYVDVELKCDIRKAYDSDDISEAINYVEIVELISKKAQLGKYQLIETLLYESLESIIEQFDKVERAFVKIRKPSALDGADFAFIEGEITRF